MKKIAILFAIVLLMFECSPEKKSIPVIDLQNINQTKVVKLSDMLGDIYVVRLETSDGILLGEDTYYLVSEKYIITIDKDKILQFSGNGKYIRNLAKAGKGPDEFLRADAWALDDKKGILYINHRGDSRHIIVFDLGNGERINRISTGVDNLISQMIVLNDTVLAVMPRMNKEISFYDLSTSGRILSVVAPPGAKGIGLESSIEMVSDKLYYMPKEYDTLYLLNGTRKEPYCFFNVEDRFTFDNNETGNFVYLSANAPNFIIANKVHARIKMNSDGETYSMNGDKITRYWVDKHGFSVSEITGFYNDYLGIQEKFKPWQDYLFLSNNLGFIKYSSFNLKQLIEKTLESEKTDRTQKDRILSLNEEINENDNPVLLIGKLKTTH